MKNFLCISKWMANNKLARIRIAVIKEILTADFIKGTINQWDLWFRMTKKKKRLRKILYSDLCAKRRKNTFRHSHSVEQRLKESVKRHCLLCGLCSFKHLDWQCNRFNRCKGHTIYNMVNCLRCCFFSVFLSKIIVKKGHWIVPRVRSHRK